jgi:hypothetical protein
MMPEKSPRDHAGARAAAPVELPGRVPKIRGIGRDSARWRDDHRPVRLAPLAGRHYVGPALEC